MAPSVALSDDDALGDREPGFAARFPAAESFAVEDGAKVLRECKPTEGTEAGGEQEGPVAIRRFRTHKL